MKRRLFLALAVAVLICLGASAWVVWEAYEFLTTSPEVPGREVTLDIAPGSTFDQAALALHRDNLITDVDKFRMLGRWEKKIGSIKAGEFLLNTSWRPLQILTPHLRNHPGKPPGIFQNHCQKKTNPSKQEKT